MAMAVVDGMASAGSDALLLPLADAPTKGGLLLVYGMEWNGMEWSG